MIDKLEYSPYGTKHEYVALPSIGEVLGRWIMISTKGGRSGADYFADLGIE